VCTCRACLSKQGLCRSRTPPGCTSCKAHGCVTALSACCSKGSRASVCSRDVDQGHRRSLLFACAHHEPASSPLRILRQVGGDAAPPLLLQALRPSSRSALFTGNPTPFELSPRQRIVCIILFSVPALRACLFRCVSIETVGLLFVPLDF